jgi:peptidoglycan/xylan/chitin deacetylase (PgdA/CDA1 family)
MAESALNISDTLLSRRRPVGVPVLLYHGISEPGIGPVPTRDGKFWITYSRFIDDLERIRSARYRIGPLRELWWLSGYAAKTPLLAITFDDGHATDYTVAFPLLHEYGFRADFFINTATVGSPGYLTWEQIDEMHRAGMSFQSHSHHHIDLSHAPLATLRRQLGHSKQLIEDRLGHPVEFLSAPYGLVNHQVMEAALEAGYRAVCNSRNWPAQLGENKISRVCIHANTGRREFEGLLARDLSPYAARSVREALLYFPRQILLRLKPGFLAVQVARGQE